LAAPAAVFAAFFASSTAVLASVTLPSEASETPFNDVFAVSSEATSAVESSYVPLISRYAALASSSFAAADTAASCAFGVLPFRREGSVSCVQGLQATAHRLKDL
jgi:hypothetical protein